MSTYFSFPIVRLLVIIALSLLFKTLVRGKARDALTPWCIAFLFVEQNIIPLTTGVTHFGVMVLYWMAMAFLLDWGTVPLISKNRQALLWCIFWGYLTLTSLWSDAPFLGVLWYLNCHIEVFLVGYFAGAWLIRREDAWQRLLMPFCIGVGFCLLSYTKHGFGVEMSETGRSGFAEGTFDEDSGFNVNAVGLAIGAMLSMFIAVIMENFDRMRQRRQGFGKIMVYIAIGLGVGFALMLVKTGSRNASLAFLPCLYYLFCGGSRIGRSAKVRRMIMAVVVLVAVVFVIKTSLSKLDSIRAFSLQGDGGSFDLNIASSGRMMEYEFFLKDMTGVDWLIGAGPVINRFPGMPTVIGGCLSVYVTLLRNVGILGMLLLLISFASVIRWGLRNGSRGKLVLLFFGVWAITGIAEGSNIRRGGGYRLLQGAAVAICSRALLDSRDQRRSNIPQWGYYPQPMIGGAF